MTPREHIMAALLGLGIACWIVALLMLGGIGGGSR